MANLSVAVADDDPAIGQTIRTWILSEDPAADIHVYESAEAIITAGRAFDIVFMDIRMGGTDGIAAARRIRERQRDTVLIFVSALREYVFEALDVHPFHFLVKPLDRGRFLRVFLEARDAARERNARSGGRLLVTTRQETISVPARDILYIERSGRKLEVHVEDRVHEMYGALDRVEEQLTDDFYRCHRAYLVNLAWVHSYRSDSIILQNGDMVFLARKKYSDFVNQYMWYLQGSHGSA